MINHAQKVIFILVVYFGLKITQVLYSSLILKETGVTLTGRIFGLAVPVLLTFFAIKEFRFAQWLMALTVLVAGVSGLFTGLFLVPFSQYFLKVIFIILGIYFSYGGYILVKTTKEKIQWVTRK